MHITRYELNVKKVSFVIIIYLAISLFASSLVYSAEAKQDDKVTIVTPDVVARLCPTPNCGTNRHITRIPKGTVLIVEGITIVKTGFLKTKWFEVTHEGKKGWISIYDTDKQ